MFIHIPWTDDYKDRINLEPTKIFLEKEKRPMKVEVQLRTIAMDFWASLEHKLRYKKNIPESEAEYLAKELVECAGISASLDQRMEAIRDRMEAAQEKIS
jgi:putative GTP pyrophosphokinase